MELVTIVGYSITILSMDLLEITPNAHLLSKYSHVTPKILPSYCTTRRIKSPSLAVSWTVGNRLALLLLLSIAVAVAVGLTVVATTSPIRPIGSWAATVTRIVVRRIRRTILIQVMRSIPVPLSTTISISMPVAIAIAIAIAVPVPAGIGIRIISRMRVRVRGSGRMHTLV